MTIGINRKLIALDRIYAVYDEFVTGLELACRMRCSRCCTRNVTLTTLEGFRIVSSFTGSDKQRLIRLIEREGNFPRFQPAMTVNRIAAYCVSGRAVPDEEAGDEGLCPLLINKLCSIYHLRPFGCRCFVSTSICDDNGFADVDEAVLTINSIFLQTIEHLDRPGCSGNLIDVLLWLSISQNEERYRQGRIDCEAPGLIQNRPLTVLMIPPEHREKVKPILDRLYRISI